MIEPAPQFPTVRHVRIPEDRAGQRIDNFLFGCLKGVPKSRIYRIIRDGQVRVNGGRVRQTYRLKADDDVRIPPVRVAVQSEPAIPGQGLAEHLADSLIYEDPWLLVYNKPAGLAVHGGSGINLGLIESLRQLRPDDRQLELVHRLDRDTSGCIMVARHRGFLRRLQRLMQQGGIYKHYWLLATGFRGEQRTIELPLLKQTRGDERIVIVSAQGKASRTDFRLLEDMGCCALLEAVLATGRTHQIRVHASHSGFPVLGDPKYGQQNPGLPGKRLYLHARSLGFRHPETGEILRLEAPLDEHFVRAINDCGGKQP